MTTIYQAIVGTLLLLVLNVGGALGSECKGTPQATCSTSDSCTWVEAYKRSNDVKVKGYCRMSRSKALIHSTAAGKHSSTLGKHNDIDNKKAKKTAKKDAIATKKAEKKSAKKDAVSAKKNAKKEATMNKKTTMKDLVNSNKTSSKKTAKTKKSTEKETANTKKSAKNESAIAKKSN